MPRIGCILQPKKRNGIRQNFFMHNESNVGQSHYVAKFNNPID